MYLYFSSNNKVFNNTLTSNGNNGVLLMGFTDMINLTESTILNNYDGIWIEDCSGISITGNTVNSNKERGIGLVNSANTILQRNGVSNNLIGLYSENSNSTINTNTVCDNTNLDFNSSAWLSSTGDNNTCSNPDGWNDTIRTGCTFKCPEKPFNCDLNNGGIYVKDYNDLMSDYNCFLGVERNCNLIHMQDWNLMKQEYDCFTGNYN